MAFNEKHLASLANLALENKASDIHIRTDEVPSLRIRGDLIPIQSKTLSHEDVMDIAQIILQKENIIENINDIHEIDGAYTVPDVCRMRYNFFRYNKNVGIVFRIVARHIPTIGELKLSPVLKEIADQKRGLILVTGATGVGKSTTLAAILDRINEKRQCHIITVEDPIEHLHTQKKALISQREIGKDTHSFTEALRSALRQDPDVILIGEMRDPETISIALKAAETGHLVLSTMHTTNAITTIGRILSMFAPEEQDDVRKRLSENLFATIGQRMIKGKEKNSVVVAQEIMITTPGIRECIRGDEPMTRIFSIVSKGKSNKLLPTQTFDQHIFQLYKDGIISKETALDSVSSQNDFLQKLDFEK